MYEILRWSVTDLHSETFRSTGQDAFILSIVPFLALLIVVAAGIRLARFNIQGTENSYFKGLPTPAVALFIAGLRILMIEPSSETFFHNVLLNINYNIAFILLLSILMVSNIRMISLKFSSFEIKKNAFRYMLIFTSLVWLLLFKQQALIFIMGTYMVLSMIHYLIYKTTDRF
jgi:CDP-diacylglycerol--serine O-phosphatidyltransferase